MPKLEDFVAEMQHAHSPFDIKMADAVTALQDIAARIESLETQVQGISKAMSKDFAKEVANALVARAKITGDKITPATIAR